LQLFSLLRSSSGGGFPILSSTYRPPGPVLESRPSRRPPSPLSPPHTRESVIARPHTVDEKAPLSKYYNRPKVALSSLKPGSKPVKVLQNGPIRDLSRGQAVFDTLHFSGFRDIINMAAGKNGQPVKIISKETIGRRFRSRTPRPRNLSPTHPMNKPHETHHMDAGARTDTFAGTHAAARPDGAGRGGAASGQWWDPFNRGYLG
jgi:hypothetical protein